MLLLADMSQQLSSSARRAPASARATGRPLSQRSLIAEGASHCHYVIRVLYSYCMCLLLLQ